MQTYADETTHAVKVECHPYSGHITAKMINYYGCGDGHCNEKDFANTEEGKHLKQQGVLLLLPNSTPLTTECNIGESVIKVEVKPDYQGMCDDDAYVNIWHNKELTLNKRRLWNRKGCLQRKSTSESVEYNLTHKQDTFEEGDLMGFLKLRYSQDNKIFKEKIYKKYSGKGPIVFK